MRQLRLACRTLFKTPLVTVVAILSLGLGIGANTAIFSLFNAILLRPLPVPEPDRLVNLIAPAPKSGSTSCGSAGDCSYVFSYPMFRDLERDQSVFTGMAAHVPFEVNLTVRESTSNAGGVLVSGSYFPVLGLTPAIGRLLAPSDDATLGEPHVAVLSHDCWQTTFGGSPDVVGERITINGQPLTVIGVAPAGFTGTTKTLDRPPAVFLPITLRHLLQPTFDGFANRRFYWAYLFARLKLGVELETARAALNPKYHAIVNDVEVPLQINMSEQTMARFKAKELLMEPGGHGQSSLRGDARPPLVTLLALTAIVLLIACANVANLLLARAAGRTTEIAVRLAIGAGRRHLVGQLLLESCVLSVLGAVSGLLFARWTIALLASLLPSASAGQLRLELDHVVLGFSAALAVGTGLIFGLFPALHSTRPNLITALRQQAGQPSGARSAAWFRNSLVTTQIALSMCLLIVAGLLTKSLFNVSRVDLGLTVDRLLVFDLSPRLNGYTAARTRALFETMEDGLRAVPGVTAVTASAIRLLDDSDWGTGVSVQGFEAGPDTDVSSRANRIGPAYFRTLEGRVLSGREFALSDAAGRPKVAIVNEAFAKKFNLGGDAVGKRVALDRMATPDIEIVGLVADMKYSGVKQTIQPLVYLPYRQDERLGDATFYVRTTADPASTVAAIRRVVTGLDPDLPIVGLGTMSEQVRDNTYVDRLIARLSASFAVLATLLAAVGLYGVLAYTVSLRTREFGVRMALGATPGGVRGLVFRQVAWMTGIGAAAGLALSTAMGGLLASLLFQMQGRDAGVAAVAVGLVVTIAIAAGLSPAVRASRIEPVNALRYE